MIKKNPDEFTCPLFFLHVDKENHFNDNSGNSAALYCPDSPTEINSASLSKKKVGPARNDLPHSEGDDDEARKYSGQANDSVSLDIKNQPTEIADKGLPGEELGPARADSP